MNIARHLILLDDTVSVYIVSAIVHHESNYLLYGIFDKGVPCTDVSQCRVLLSETFPQTLGFENCTTAKVASCDQQN